MGLSKMREVGIPDIVGGWMVKTDSFQSFEIESGLSGYMDSVRQKTVRDCLCGRVFLEAVESNRVM